MSRRLHYDVKKPLPSRTLTDANNQTHDVTNLSNYPVCVGAQGTVSPLTNGTPGPTTFITWTAPTNPVYDTFTFISPSTPTTNLRIPQDGFYDFWYMLVLPANSAGNFAVRSILDTAETSDSGFGTPVWTRAQSGPSEYFHSNVMGAVGGQLRWEVLYRGWEMHANNLFRIGLNLWGDGLTGDITGATINYSEFRFVYAIPNDAVQGTQW